MHREFGFRLKLERRRLRLSQEQLSRVLGVRRLVVANYESGKRSLTIDKLELLQAQGFDLGYLLGASPAAGDLAGVFFQDSAILFGNKTTFKPIGRLADK